MKYLLYCVTKREDLVYFAICSIASLAKTVDIAQYKIVVITDFPDLLDYALKQSNISCRENIIIEPISKTTLEEWIGRNQYVFRVKIKAIEYFFKKYKSNVLFVDCDMYAIRNFDELFTLIDSGKFLMFARYGVTIADYISREYPGFFHPGGAHIAERKMVGSKILLSKDDFSCEVDSGMFPMLSCLVGMHYKYEFVIQKVLTYCDHLYEITGFYTTEEIAFMLVFKKYGRIILTTRYFNTSKSEKWIQLLLGFLCGVLANDDLRECQSLLERVSLGGIMRKNIPYSYENLRYLIAVTRFRLTKKEPGFDDILRFAKQNHDLLDDLEEVERFHTFYSTYIER